MKQATLGMGLTMRLAAKLFRHHCAAALLLALTGVLAVATVTFLATTHQSALNALRDGVTAERGHAEGWVVQATDAGVAAVHDVAGLTGVTITSGEVANYEALSPAGLTVVGGGDARLGALLEGRRPQRPGEIMLSRSLADTLDAPIGSSVDVSSDTVAESAAEVVGISIDPADRTAVHAYLVDPRLDAHDVTFWLADDLAWLDTDGLSASVSSTNAAIDMRLRHAPGVIQNLRFVVPGAGLLLLLVVLGALLLLVRSVRTDVDGLVGAGLPHAIAWRVPRVVAGLALLAGGLVGAVSGWTLVRLLADRLSSGLDQYWLSVAAPGALTVVTLVAPLLVLALPVGAATGVRRVATATPWARTGRILGGAAGGVGLFGAALIALGIAGIRGVISVESPVLLVMCGLLALLAAAALAGGVVAAVRSGPAMRTVIRTVGSQVVLVSVACGVLAGTTAGYAAWLTGDTHAFVSLNEDLVNDGALMVIELDQDAAERVLVRYREAGGQRFKLYEIPDESKVRTRGVSLSFADCISIKGMDADECWDLPGVGMAHVVLDSGLEKGAIRVSPNVVEDDTVIVISVDVESRDIVKTLRIESSDDVSLSGWGAPGLVVAPDSEVAEVFSLVPSGHVDLTLDEFGGLDPRAAAEIRALLRRLAPGALVNDPSSSFREKSLGIANLVALVGATLVALVLAAVAAMVMGAHRHTRRTISQLGASLGQRLAIAVRLMSPPLLVVAVAVVTIPWLAKELTGFADIGWVWTAPLIAMAVISCVATALLARAPDEAASD